MDKLDAQPDGLNNVTGDGRPLEMEARVAVLEQIAKDTKETLGEIKQELRDSKQEVRGTFGELKNDLRDTLGEIKQELRDTLGDIKQELREIRKEQKSDFRWLLALIIGLAGIMAHGFHWF